jgi:hypothetical protein
MDYYSTICLRVKSEKLKKAVSYRGLGPSFLGQTVRDLYKRRLAGHHNTIKAGFGIELPTGEHQPQISPI